MTRIRIYPPAGPIGSPERTLAAAPATLAGRRLAVLDNGKPGAARLLGGVARGLAERTGASFAGVFQKGSAATPCEDAVFEEILSDADVVLTGTAD